MSKDDAINITNRVFYKFFYNKFFVIYKNEWEYWFNLFSKKPRRDIK